MRTVICLLFIGFLAFSLAGCLPWGNRGGSGTDISHETPERAVLAQVDEWKAGNGFHLNLINRQVFNTATPTASVGTGTISFTDLSGNSWVFEIISIEYPSSNQAVVKTAYSFPNFNDGRLLIDFYAQKSEGKWRLDDIKATGIPVVVPMKTGLQGQIVDEKTGLPVAGALVSLAGTDYSTATDQSGWYGFPNLPAGTYTVVVVRDGYVIKTITGVVVR